MMTILLISSILLSFGFIIYAVIRKGVLPDSISAIVFDLKHPWAWSIWLWAVTITLAPSLLEAMPENWQALAFLTLAFLLFTGVLPLIDKEHIRWHYILGFLAGLFSQACVWKICPWFLLLWIIMVLYVIVGIVSMNDKVEDGQFDGKGVIIAELIAMVAVFGSVIVKNFLIGL